MKNNANRPALLLLVASIVLVCLRFVPSFTILGYEVKSVDLLSDLLTTESSGSGVGDLGLMDEEQKVVPHETLLSIGHKSSIFLPNCYDFRSYCA